MWRGAKYWSLSILNAVAARVGCRTGISASLDNPSSASSASKTKFPSKSACASSLNVIPATRTPSKLISLPSDLIVAAAKLYATHTVSGNPLMSGYRGHNDASFSDSHSDCSTELEISNTNTTSAIRHFSSVVGVVVAVVV